MTQPTLTLDELRALIGRELGTSDWIEIDQPRIDAFATATLDDQFIHVDVERAKASPFGGTIAHGFLTLSLLSHMNFETMPLLEGEQLGVNYGFNKLRFVTAVKSGQRVRGRFLLRDVVERSPGQIMLATDVTVEIEGEVKPALVAEWLTLSVTSADP